MTIEPPATTMSVPDLKRVINSVWDLVVKTALSRGTVFMRSLAESVDVASFSGTVGIEIRVEAAHIVASLSYGSEHVLETLLRLQQMPSSPPIPTRYTYARALRAMLASVTRSSGVHICTRSKPSTSSSPASLPPPPTSQPASSTSSPPPHVPPTTVQRTPPTFLHECIAAYAAKRGWEKIAFPTSPSASLPGTSVITRQQVEWEELWWVVWVEWVVRVQVVAPLARTKDVKLQDAALVCHVALAKENSEAVMSPGRCLAQWTMLSSQDSLSKSPFNAWITSNYAPTDWERQQIKTYLVPVVESSLALDAAIQDARRTLESLLEDKATIDATISAHEAILRPIRRLPPDILREILAQCLPVDQPPTMESDKAPLTLTRVCRSWRKIALSSPELWHRIHITAPQGPDAYLKFHQERIERWPFESTLDVILAHSHRIGTLDLDVSDRFLQEFDNRQTVETWPLLESVTLCWAGWTSDEPNISSLKIWNAPMLKSIKLISVDVEVLSLPVKWTQLQSISLPLVERDLYDHEIGVAAREMLLTHEMARLLLESAPLLSSLHVSIADEDRSMPAPHPVPSSLSTPCVQAHLTILYLDDISVHSDSNAPALLDNLQLPSLRTLHYHLDSSQNGETSFTPLPPSNMNPVYRFLVSQAQPCSITCWRITRHSMQHSAFINCLKLMPALERLYVEDEQLQDLGFVPQVVDPY
ncbi:hypothetical protein D9611_014299 [Ephemerocybe angulata]|uniref:F-box domain-containing protein n=1 Tax=Ephemerocybe angulata TaxID=980116 RepID=A0A8H5BTJ7_9AGAR|nr:hypothetical protein D9611_014299 [Tulosesus angulatus]